MTQITDHAGQMSTADTATAAGFAADVVSPLASKMLFWRARYVQRSDFLHHLPFLFWLVEAMRPAQTLVLGMGDGVAHFAICQAVDKLDLATRCQAIGQWPVPAQTPPAAPAPAPAQKGTPPLDPAPADLTGTVPAEIGQYNATNYAEFSTIAAQDQSTALARTAAGSIDLLCIDLAMPVQMLDALTYAWPTKLSRRGVMLLHGIDSHFSSPEALAFLALMHRTHPTISFATGAGLVAVLWGPDQPYRLTKLAGADPTSAAADSNAEVKQIFTRLGLLHRLEWEAPHEAGQYQIAATALRHAQTDLTAAQTSLVDLNTAYEARNTKTALYQSRVYDLEQEKAATRAEVATALAQVDATLADQARTAALHRQLTADLEDLSADFAQQKAAWQAQLEHSVAQLAAHEADWQLQTQALAQTLTQTLTAEHQAQLDAHKAEFEAKAAIMAAQAGDGPLHDIMALTAALSQLQAEKHALIEAARPRLPDQGAAGTDAPNMTADPGQTPTHNLTRGPIPGKTGLWGRFKRSVMLAPLRFVVRGLRPGNSVRRGGGPQRGGDNTAPGLLTRFKRSALMAPARAVVRAVRRRRKNRLLRTGSRSISSRSISSRRSG